MSFFTFLYLFFFCYPKRRFNRFSSFYSFWQILQRKITCDAFLELSSRKKNEYCKKFSLQLIFHIYIFFFLVVGALCLPFSTSCFCSSSLCFILPSFCYLDLVRVFFFHILGHSNKMLFNKASISLLLLLLLLVRYTLSEDAFKYSSTKGMMRKMSSMVLFFSLLFPLLLSIFLFSHHSFIENEVNNKLCIKCLEEKEEEEAHTEKKNRNRFFFRLPHSDFQ